MVDAAQLSELAHDPALGDYGVADFMHIRYQQLSIGFRLVAASCPTHSLAHIQPQTLLSLAWPRYLQELAASKTPITQVHNLL